MNTIVGNIRGEQMNYQKITKGGPLYGAGKK